MGTVSSFTEFVLAIASRTVIVSAETNCVSSNVEKMILKHNLARDSYISCCMDG